MPTATLLIEIVIIGLFANLNLFLLFSLFVPFGSRLGELWQSLSAQEGAAALVLFGVALASYVLGVIVNVSVSTLFDPIDDHIREESFNAQRRAELNSLDPWIGREERKTSELYHYMRYCLYAHGQQMKEQLDQHRSEIRILRATALNSYWLMVILLCPPLSLVVGKIYGAVMALLFIAMALLIAWNLAIPQPSGLKRWKADNKDTVYYFYLGAFGVAICLPWLMVITGWLATGGKGPWLSSLVAGGIAIVSLLLWTKQQQRFYEALLHGFRALAVNRKGEHE